RVRAPIQFAGEFDMNDGNDSQGAAAPARAYEERTAVADLEQGGGSLDKVRDILFGVQMRESEKRFMRLEERLAKEIADIKDDVKKRLAALEMYTKKEIESLEDRLRAEQETRTQQDKDLSRELKDHTQAFEKRTSALDDGMARGHKDLRQQLL